MTNADTRQAIATALSTVDMVTGYTSSPSTPRVGDGWPQWAGAERGPGHNYTNTWNVLVVLAQDDEVTADAFVDSHFEDIEEALSPILFIDSIVPAQIPGTTPMLALLIVGRSE